MQLIAVTTCTDRKRYPVLPSLDASRLPSGSQSIVVSGWRQADWRSTVLSYPANDVYCGRSFQEAVFIGARNAQIFASSLAASASFARDQAIPSYSLSLKFEIVLSLSAHVSLARPLMPQNGGAEFNKRNQTAPVGKIDL